MAKELRQKKELSGMTYFWMGSAALFFDLAGAIANLIPFAGQMLDLLLDFIADSTFWLWHKMAGAEYSKSTLFGTFAVKFIPILNILPEYTLMVVLLYLQAKARKTPVAGKVLGQAEKQPAA